MQKRTIQKRKAIEQCKMTVREHRRKISEVYLPMVQNRSMSAKEYNRKVDEAYRAMVMEMLTSKHQFDLVRQLPDMVRDRSATASNYLTVLKAVVRSKAPYLPEDIVVRPARDYAHLIDRVRDAPPSVAGVAIPVGGSALIEDGALVIEYKRVLIMWFTPTRIALEHYRVPPQRGASEAAARERVAHYLLDLAGTLLSLPA